MMDAHVKELSEVFAGMKATADGLTAEEAKARLADHGPNELPREKNPSRLLQFLKQFNNPLTYVLGAATAISVFTGHVFDAAAISIELVINAIFGFLQERKAEQALSRLRDMAAPEAVVRRGGRLARIPAAQLVP